MATIRSGQSSSASESSSSSAYAVVLKNHCSIIRASTSAPQYSQWPSRTCSFASTTWSCGHHLTGASLRYASPASKQLQEQPLRPAVVRGLVRVESSRVQSNRVAEPLELPADVLDVPLDDLARMAALADRRVLGGQAERVVAHRPQHVHAVAAAEVREDVADRVDEHVPHVQRPGRVRQHLEHVALAGGLGPGLRDSATSKAPVSSQTFCHFASIAAASYRSITLSCCPETKKPLDREAVGSLSRRGRDGFLRYARRPCTVVQV